jgi:coenzyme F420-reducing hydrogenase beta subunit
MCNFKEYNKLKCCGCGSCELICPKNSIKMEYDNEGFIYPVLDKESCIECGLCKTHCPIINESKNKTAISTYGLIHIDKCITDDSASGGAFTALAEYILSQDGIVFGCAFNENIEAVTISVENNKDLHLLRGSKYVQCNTDKQYYNIKMNLENNRQVLYCSTPCQIAGLKAYLKKDYDNLLLIDLFCHGAPSPMLFKKYIEWLGKKHKSKITEYSFRDKKYGWGTMGHYNTDQEFKLYDSDPYYFSFIMGKTYRPVCYECKYATSLRTGDITIGDFWGVENNHPEVTTNNGVSAILINTVKGMTVLESIKDQVHLFDTTFDNIAKYNPQLIHPAEKPIQRDIIYSHFNKWTFNRLAKKYLYLEPFAITRLRKIIPRPIIMIFRKQLKLLMSKYLSK